MSNCNINDGLNLNYNLPPKELVEVFLDRAGNTYSYKGSDKKVNLIIFLEYFKFKLAHNEQAFITKLTTKYSHIIENSEYQSRRKGYKDLLAKARKEQPQQLLISEPAKIDKEIIVGYDLESLAPEFTQRVGYEGIFAFAISGHDTILKDYIIERILRELKYKTERPYRKIDVRLYATDILTGGQVIESKLKIYNECQNIVDLFLPEICLDIVLVIWLYDIPEKIRQDMESVAINFCQKTRREVHPFISNKSRCFVIIFANVGFEHPVNGLTSLTIPKEFETTSLLQWFRGRLKQLELEDYVIEQYLLRLQSQHGHLIGTYQELQYIISELQRGNLNM
ncbi:hypothetical protein [Floridanema aerugineum]|uniref:Uncharacterized protein n=1 Tax=Floridaenema aerugineum BLCC-F46 TaxID=3153654 RepID=A0ABV4X629_9CYAN